MQFQSLFRAKINEPRALPVQVRIIMWVFTNVTGILEENCLCFTSNLTVARMESNANHRDKTNNCFSACLGGRFIEDILVKKKKKVHVLNLYGPTLSDHTPHATFFILSSGLVILKRLLVHIYHQALMHLDGRCFLWQITLQITGRGKTSSCSSLSLSPSLSVCLRVFQTPVLVPLSPALPGRERHLWSSILSTNLYHLPTLHLRKPSPLDVWLNLIKWLLCQPPQRKERETPEN